MMKTIWQDLRFGLRLLRKTPVFTAAIVLTLGLGIGANTAIFSVVDAVLLKSLPVNEPARLYHLKDVPLTGGAESSLVHGPTTVFTFREYKTFREQNSTFDGLAAYRIVDRVSAGRHGQSEMATAQVVSGNYFSVLGVGAFAGRPLTEADDQSDAEPAALVSHRYWKSRFGEDLSILGSTVTLNNKQFTVVGVTPPEFFGFEPGDWPDLILPMAARKYMTLGGAPAADDSSFAHIVVRLPPDRNESQALADLKVIFGRLLAERNETKSSEREPRAPARTIELVPGNRGFSWTREQLSKPLLIIVAIVCFVLILACLNIAVMLLARHVRRQKEIAVRLALGASRFRVVRQLLIESLILAALGGLTGILIAHWGTRFLLQNLIIGPNSVAFDVRPDGRVLLFTSTISSLSGILFGLLPALRATRIDVLPAIKEGAVGFINQGKSIKLGQALIVVQIMLSVIILVGAGLFARTLRNLKQSGIGFSPENLLLVTTDPGLVGYKGNRVTNLYRALQERLAAMPGVGAVSFSTFAPIGQIRGIAMAEVPGFAATSEDDRIVSINKVGPDYFETVGTPVLSGRDVNVGDVADAPKIVIINRSMARQYFPDVNPVGRRFTLVLIGEKREVEVQGVVEDSRFSRVQEAMRPTVFTPLLQDANPGRVTFAVRARGNPLALVNGVRHEVAQIDSAVPLFDATTAAGRIDESLAQERLLAHCASFFGGLSLFLICIGLFGILSYEVDRRKREIGIRVALGARGKDVLTLFLSQGAKMAIIGIGLGLLGAAALTRLISGVLYGVSATDPVTFIIIPLAMSATILTACLFPARRAAKVDPLEALRYE